MKDKLEIFIPFITVALVLGILALFEYYAGTKTITGSYTFTPPENSTEVNIWLQAQCVSKEVCTPTDLIIKDIHVDGLIDNQFTNLTTTADIMNRVEWSEEYGLIGCNDQLDGCSTFLPPQNTFNLENGQAVISIPSGNYIGLLSCNIEKECSRAVSQQEYTGHVNLCHGNDNDTLINVRLGVDFLTERNGEFINSDFSQWYTLGKGDCLVM